LATHSAAKSEAGPVYDDRQRPTDIRKAAQSQALSAIFAVHKSGDAFLAPVSGRATQPDWDRLGLADEPALQVFWTSIGEAER
jgi:hypothetical protein